LLLVLELNKIYKYKYIGIDNHVGENKSNSCVFYGKKFSNKTI
jgi:hypothetical protein